MPSAAAFFVAINGSGSIIRSFFLPFCSLLLLSPFAATLVEYSGLSQDLYPFLPALSSVPKTLFLLFVLVLNTRIWTTQKSRAEAQRADGTVPSVPYWIAGLRHFPELTLFGIDFLRSVRDVSKEGIFALYLGGQKHNFVYDPSLIAAFNAQDDKNPSIEPLEPIALKNTFDIRGVSPRELSQVHHIIVQLLSKQFGEAKSRDKMVKAMVNNYSENLPNLVTFMPSIVDQTAWERMSQAVVSDKPGGGEEVEVNLMSLLLAFIGISSLPGFVGNGLLENYPELLNDLLALNSSFFLLALGLPRWFPIPGLVPAHVARKRLLSQVSSFNRALDLFVAGKDPGPGYDDLGDVSGVYVALQATLRDLPIDTRNGLSLYAIWVVSVNPILLTAWTVVRVLSEGPTAELRKEISPYVSVTQTPPTLGFSEPPRLKIDANSLAKKCPQLKACLIEAARLDSHHLVHKQLQGDISISSSTGSTSFAVKKGEFVNIAYSLYHSDPRYFSSPDLFLPSRHVKKSVGGDIEPFGFSDTERSMAEWAERQSLSFVAGLIALWHVEFVDEKMRTPQKKRGVTVDIPKGDVRVRFRRRVVNGSGSES